MALEAHFLGVEPQCSADHLREMKDGHVDGLACLAGRLGLKLVQVQVTQRTWSDQDMGALLLRLQGVVAYHLQPVVLVDRHDREPAAAQLALIVDRFAADLDFLSLILNSGVPVADEVVGACLRSAASTCPDQAAFLARAGRALATELASDLPRLNAVLRRVAP